MQDIMRRVAHDLDVDEEELRSADYWDLMGGVGFGGFCALLLGRLRMSVEQAMEELAAIGATLFPRDPDEIVTPEANTTRMIEAMENMLRRHNLSPDIKLNDKTLPDPGCKVIVFAATLATTGHCHPFRTYRSRYGTPNCTFIEAACATLATPGLFFPIAIGPPGRKQMFVGTPLGFNNPMRRVLNEARMEFGEEMTASLLLSVGSGRSAILSLDVRPSNPHSYRDLLACVALDCERVARELEDQLLGIESYVRLNVNQGMENIDASDWHELGPIEAHTAVYLQLPTVMNKIDVSARMIQERVGSVSLGQLTRTSTFFIAKFNPQQCTNHLALSPMAIKQIGDIVREGVEAITLVDAIGNHIPIPLHLCRSYSMLSGIILAYFQDQKPPGSSLVKRGDYQLISGNKGSVIDPSVWAYLRQSGLIVEMSMIRDGDRDGMRCPRCEAPAQGAHNEWVTCSHCQGRFQTIEKPAGENDRLPPRSPTSGKTPTPSQIERNMHTGQRILDRLIAFLDSVTFGTKPDSIPLSPTTTDTNVTVEEDWKQFRLITVATPATSWSPMRISHETTSCRYCGLTFSNRSPYGGENHWEIHLAEDTRRWVCLSCGDIEEEVVEEKLPDGSIWRQVVLEYVPRGPVETYTRQEHGHSHWVHDHGRKGMAWSAWSVIQVHRIRGERIEEFPSYGSRSISPRLSTPTRPSPRPSQRRMKGKSSRRLLPEDDYEYLNTYSTLIPDPLQGTTSSRSGLPYLPPLLGPPSSARPDDPVPFLHWRQQENSVKSPSLKLRPGSAISQTETVPAAS